MDADSEPAIRRLPALRVGVGVPRDDGSPYRPASASGSKPRECSMAMIGWLGTAAGCACGGSFDNGRARRRGLVCRPRRLPRPARCFDRDRVRLRVRLRRRRRLDLAALGLRCNGFTLPFPFNFPFTLDAADGSEVAAASAVAAVCTDPDAIGVVTSGDCGRGCAKPKTLGADCAAVEVCKLGNRRGWGSTSTVSASPATESRVLTTGAFNGAWLQGNAPGRWRLFHHVPPPWCAWILCRDRARRVALADFRRRVFERRRGRRLPVALFLRGKRPPPAVVTISPCAAAVGVSEPKPWSRNTAWANRN